FLALLQTELIDFDFSAKIPGLFGIQAERKNFCASLDVTQGEGLKLFCLPWLDLFKKSCVSSVSRAHHQIRDAGVIDARCGDDRGMTHEFREGINFKDPIRHPYSLKLFQGDLVFEIERRKPQTFQPFPE